MTPDRSAPEGLVEALAGAVCECGHPVDHHGLNGCLRNSVRTAAVVTCTCERHPTEALAPTVAQLIDAAVAQRTAHLVIEGERLREVVGRVEALAEEATERAYFDIAIEKMLTVMCTATDRAHIPGHWRDEAERRASVNVADLRAALRPWTETGSQAPRNGPVSDLGTSARVPGPDAGRGGVQ